MAITKLGKLATRNTIRVRDIKPALTQSDLPALTFADIPLPRNYRAGLVTTRTNAQDITIAAGQARGTGDSGNILVTSAITKALDADWVEGDGGGFPETAISTGLGSTYHAFVIGKADNSAFDAGFDNDLEAANLLDGDTAGASGYTTYRRVASFVLDPSASPHEILDYTQVGNQFILAATRLTNEDTNIGTSAKASTVVGCPTGLQLLCEISFRTDDPNAYHVNVSSLDANDEAASDTAAPLLSLRGASGIIDWQTLHVRTDTSNRIRLDSTEASLADFRYALRGWMDDLGAYD
jgi:hypothetical protein